MLICSLSSQMNASGGFSAPLNGFQSGHPVKLSRCQKRETPKRFLGGTPKMTDVENPSQTGPPDEPLSSPRVEAYDTGATKPGA
jgi:hypothetical protein